MKKRILLLTTLMAVVLAGCVKSTIDLNKVSGDVSLQPAFVISAVKGELTLADLVEPGDTLVIDADNSMKLVFSEDSVINFGLADFYESFPPVNLDKSFPLLSVPIDNVEEMLVVDPGNDIKLKEMAVINGGVSYSITSECSFSSDVHLLFSSVTMTGVPLSTVITVGANSTASGTIDLSGYLIDLTTDPANSYNRLPVEYSIIPSGSPTFTVTDIITVSISFEEPEFDYIKGYFGINESILESDTIDTGLDEIYSKITGSISLTNPSIVVNYDNSFGIPLTLTADIRGENQEETIYLDRDPIDIDHPVSESIRDISSSFSIDRDNSSLPELISMLPGLIIMGGDATSNPLGETAQDNIIFGDSRFIAGMEVEIPFEFKINDLQLSDTTDNFLLDDENGDSPLDMLSRLRIDFYFENGFPLGGDITLSLYDTLTATVLEQVTTDELFAPADVDSNGRVITPAVHSSSIEFTPAFLAAVESANKIIFTFTLYTTDHGTRDVKIYSDYSIVFKAGLSLKADLQLK